MSDHVEHACTLCGSLLHHEDECPPEANGIQADFKIHGTDVVLTVPGIIDPVDPWQDIANDKQAERERCRNIVQSEIDTGLAAGVPLTSGAMRVLHRIRDAILNGG